GQGPASAPDPYGLQMTDVDFTLLLFTDQATGTTYSALKTSGGTASLVGDSELELSAYNFSVNLNVTSDVANPGKVLDFSAAGGGVVTSVSGPALDFDGADGSLQDVTGSAVLNVPNALAAKGEFKIVLGQVVADLPSGAGQAAD